MGDKKPFFPMYPADFLTATGHWSNAEVGAYFRLLCFQWVNGSIPTEPRRIANIVGVQGESFDEMWSVVGVKFKDDGNGGLCNRRMEQVRTEVNELSAKRSEAARIGNKARWGDRKRIANGIAKASPSKSKSNTKLKSKAKGKEEEDSSKDESCPADAVSETAKVTDKQIQEVFDRHLEARSKFYVRKNGRKPSSLPDLTKQLKKSIRRAIEMHGIEKAKAAGVGIFYSPFHRGDETGKEYLAPHLCWRIQTGAVHDVNNVERFSALYFDHASKFKG